MRKFFLPVLVALGLFATAMPANAAPFQWTDAEGDAGFDGLPAPSEPALDVTKVRMEVVKDNLIWTATIAKLGPSNPPGSTGTGYQFSLTYGEASGTIQVYDDTLIGKATEFRLAATGASTEVTPCGKCVGVIDRKSSKIVVTTPLSSLHRALKTADKSAKPFAPGAKITGLEFTTRRLYSVGQPGAYASYGVDSDNSAPTGDATFTF